MPASSSSDAAADVAAVIEVWQQYCAALIAGDMDRWISLWCDHGIQMPPESPAKKGRVDIREAMQPLLDLYDWDISISPEETRVAGDWAFSSANYTWAWTPRVEGEKMAGTGKFLTVFRRQEDGSWKIARDCFNGNGPTSRARLPASRPGALVPGLQAWVRMPLGTEGRIRSARPRSKARGCWLLRAAVRSGILRPSRTRAGVGMPAQG